MASPNPSTPYTASPSYRPPLGVTLQALEQLVNFDLSKDEILLMSKLGAVGVGKILDLFQNEGRSAVDQLLGSLEGHSEKILGSMIDVAANDRNERARSVSLNPPRSSIDNGISATTATLFATPYLHPPIPLKRSASTGTRCSVSSRGSSSTNITHPSNKVIKRRPVPQPARRQFYCPDCGKPIRNAFLNHFKKHIDHLIAPNIGEHDAIGCGYCPAHGLFADGKVFHGPDNFATHVKDAHASSQTRLHWDFNASFNHILSAQQFFRRNILQKISQETGPRANSEGSLPTLSWSFSPLTRKLLRELQIVSGKISVLQARYTEAALDDLLSRVYHAAAQKWQPLAEFSDLSERRSSAVHGVIPPLAIRPPTTRSSQDAMEFAHIGQGFFDTPTPRYAEDIVSPSVAASPRTVLPAPAQVRGAFQQGEVGVRGGGPASATFHATLPARHVEPGVIAFDGHAGFAGGVGAPRSPVGLPKEESFEELFSSVLGPYESDLAEGQM